MRFLIVAAALSVAPTLIADQAQRPDWSLQVGLFGYRADGTISTTAFETHLSQKSFVYITDRVCGLGAGMGPHSRSAIYAWSFTGKEIEVTPELAIIQLDWQRVIDNGQPAAGPGGSVQLTILAGEHVTLDSVLPAHAVSCWSTVGFEVRYRANPFPQNSWRLQRIQRPEGHDGRGGRDITPEGSASTGGTATGGPAQSAGATAPNAAANATGYDVHLWLVRSTPGRPEESQYRQLNVAGVHTPFAFAPLSIATPEGAASVMVTGSLSVKGNVDGEHLLLIMHRNITPPAGTAASPRYSEARIEVLPTPDKTLSLEMPPLPLGDQQLPDRLSLRLRVEPR